MQLLKKHTTVFLFFSSALFLTYISYIYYQHAISFNFIDEYNNYLAGYFLLLGNKMYSQIFFQHNVLMAYISYGIQFILHPKTLYQLVLDHRLFTLLFGVCFDIFLIIRFRFLGLGFALLYELSKFYLFGSLFLAESIIVYPIVYLFLLNFYLLTRKKIATSEIIVAGIATWFCVFMREPYIPLALFLYCGIVCNTWKQRKIVLSSLAIFFVLTGIILITTDISAFIFEVFKVNYVAVAQGETASNGLQGLGLLKIFLYPIALLTGGVWNNFRIFAVGIDIVYILTSCLILLQKKYWKVFLFSFICLSLAAFRLVPPGTLFFVAYHMIIWYGLLFVISLSQITVLRFKNYSFLRILLFASLFIFVFYGFFYSSSYLKDHINREQEFTTNYGRFYSYGEAIKDLALPRSTLFVDSWDSLIYWQAKLPSSYPYLFYYVPMDAFPIYTDARTVMFNQNPPDFYYFYIGETKYYSPGIPPEHRNDYIQLVMQNSPSGLYVKKSIISKISQIQWNKAKSLGFSLPVNAR